MSEPREFRIVLVQEPQPKPKTRWENFGEGFERVSKILSIAAIPIALGISGSCIDKSIKDRSLSKEYVQIALSVLEEPDTNKVKPGLRSWAADLLNKESPIEIDKNLLADFKNGTTVLPEPKNAQTLQQMDPLPSKNGINVGLTRASNALLLSVFGKPGALTDGCSDITNPRLKRLVVSENVGPFTVQGLKPAVDTIKRVFDAIGREHHEYLAGVKSLGMLCVRAVRGSGSQYSSHSFGVAIDLSFGERLSGFGEPTAPRGLQLIAPYFQKERFYWAAGDARPDAMHFEPSKELIEDWVSTGQLPL
jgi:hypothetical protein